MKVAEAVKKLRLSLGLQQDEFAKELGCKPATVSHWECGTRQPRLPWVRAMMVFAKKNKIALKLDDFIGND